MIKQMLKNSLLVAFLAMALSGWSQMAPDMTEVAAKPTLSEAYAKTITADDLRAHLTVLASDEYEGRETGTEGQQKAAVYIANHFKSLGLPAIGDENSYFQEIVYTAVSWQKLGLEVGKTRFKNLWDFYAFPGTNVDRPSAEFSDLYFLGFGIDDEKYSDYDGVDVEGKAILIYPGEPMNADSVSYVTGSKEISDWSDNWRKKLMAAHEHGVAAVFIIDYQIQKSIAEQRRFMLSPRMRIGPGEEPEGKYANNVFVSTTVAKEMMGKKFKKVVQLRDKIKETGKPQSYRIKKTNISLIQEKKMRQLIGSNVLAYIEGSDPQLKDELVIVTAHYDHLGKRGSDIYNGADDNGSGTSTVLEVTEALVEAKKAGHGPRRSVLCMLVSGEEKGLLGSKYYVENPLFPLENTIANVNVDMVGRVDEKYADNPEYVYVIGSDRLSTALHSINETANATYTNLTLDYTYNADDDPNRYYYRSDHYNFAEKGIPAIFYFNGTHPDYHRITDTVDKIQFDKMAKIGQLVFHVTYELANRDERIQVDVEGRN
jgi:hypothetical protein